MKTSMMRLAMVAILVTLSLQNSAIAEDPTELQSEMMEVEEAIADSEVNHEWSELLAKELYLAGKPYTFYTYPGSRHFPEGEMRQQTVDRDVAFFRCLMVQGKCPLVQP